MNRETNCILNSMWSYQSGMILVQDDGHEPQQPHGDGEVRALRRGRAARARARRARDVEGRERSPTEFNVHFNRKLMLSNVSDHCRRSNS